MFAARYFAPRYYAPRYWPNVGAGTTEGDVSFIENGLLWTAGENALLWKSGENALLWRGPDVAAALKSTIQMEKPRDFMTVDEFIPRRIKRGGKQTD